MLFKYHIVLPVQTNKTANFNLGWFRSALYVELRGCIDKKQIKNQISEYRLLG